MPRVITKSGDSRLDQVGTVVDAQTLGVSIRFDDGVVEGFRMLPVLEYEGCALLYRGVIQFQTYASLGIDDAELLYIPPPTTHEAWEEENSYLVKSALKIIYWYQ